MGALRSASAESGLLLVQVDGLSHAHLRQALDRGLMPNLEQALESGRYEVDEFRSGLPAHTGVVEAGVLYGRSVLPSNQWLDKATGEVLNVTGSHTSDLIEDGFLANGAHGLIEGGSTYLSPLSGHASRANLTLNDIARARRTGGTRAVIGRVSRSFAELAWNLALHPGQAVRSAARFALALGRGVRERKRDDIPQHVVADRLKPAVWSALQNVTLTDASVRAMARRMKKGDPAIFIDLPGFDDIGHAFGPQRAMRELTEIDRNIGVLMRSAEKGKRPYNVVLYSDHGQTACARFNELYGQSLGQYVTSLLPTSTPQAAPKVPDPDAEPALPHVDPADVEGDDRMTFLDFGTGAHLYFHLSSDALDGAAVEGAYPGLVAKIAAHPGVGFVVTRDGDASDIMGKNGHVRVENGHVTVTGENPLVVYGSEGVTAFQLHDQAHRAHAGDVLVFGGFVGDKIVNFSLHPQGGTHGGPGNTQDVAFVVAPAGLGLDMHGVMQASALHEQLRDILPSDSPAARRT